MSEVANLDEKRTGRDDTHSFLIGGEKFTARVNVRPDIRADWERGASNEDDSVQALERTDRMIQGFLIPDDRDRWTKLREREADPVTLDDIRLLIEHLFEVSGGRPTQASSSSSSGEGSDAASSTGESSSPEATPTT